MEEANKNDNNFLTVPLASSILSIDLKPMENSNAGTSTPKEFNSNLTKKLFSRRITDLEDEKLDNWKPSSSSSVLKKATNTTTTNNGENYSGSESDDSIKELMKRVNAGRKKVQFSERSRKLLEDSQQLLDSIGNRDTPQQLIGLTKPGESSMNPLPEGYASTSRYLLNNPRFQRVDFDDMIEEDFQDRKPAWQQLQESIKSSYHKPKRTIESHKELNEANDYYLNRLKPRSSRTKNDRRSPSPFSHLDGESFLPRAQSWYANGAIQPRGLFKSISTMMETTSTHSGPYAAPTLEHTKGIEGATTSKASSRYDRMAEDVEARLLKISVLPEHMKTITKREFQRAPLPSAGSASEDYASEVDLMNMLPRPFYSRPNREDPDYFDFDLQHSVDMYRKPEGQYHPRGPQPWETKLLNEYKGKGDAPLSGHMFTKGLDWRNTGTSYLSAALRTPKFWEQRFSSIGTQIRDSNPISLASIERNKPIPNKFTEYRDPDFEDYEDPRKFDG